MITFLVALSLAIGLFAAIPLVAHFYRRGRAKPIDFAPVRFLEASPPIAKQRSRLDDRALLLVRISLIFLLALLGSTPLIRCDRQLLDRQKGASVGRVLILDDSGSMNARLPGGMSRFERARKTALELVEQMRYGDSFGLVLASRPARMWLSPSGQKDTLRAEIAALRPTCRPTDVSAALGIARAALKPLPQSDKQVLLLSDLGGTELSLGEDATALLPALREPVVDCAVLRAQRKREQIQVDYACSPASPSGVRTLLLVEEKSPDRVLAQGVFTVEREGVTTLIAPSQAFSGAAALAVRLLEPDDNSANDLSPLITEEFGLSIGSYSDPSTGRAATGGPPIIEQALRAIEPNFTLRPLATVPDDPKQLRDLSVLLLDDPPPLSAESRVAITNFAEHGGTAVALFGPAAASVQLGHLHLPFLKQDAQWQPRAPGGLLPESLDPKLTGLQSLANLGAQGRLVFDENHDAKVIVRARWSDQVPFWIERPLGRGQLTTLGLPSSVQWSDWALRPGFLSILTDLITARDRNGQGRVVTAGTPFQFPSSARVTVTLPEGTVRPVAEVPGAVRQWVPEQVGRYWIDWSGDREERLALWPAEETLDVAKSPIVTAARKANQTTGRMDLSQYIAMAVVAMMALELGLRATSPSAIRKWLVGRFTRRKSERGDRP